MCFAAAGLWRGLRGKDRHTWTLASQYRAQASEVWLEYRVLRGRGVKNSGPGLCMHNVKYFTESGLYIHLSSHMHRVPAQQNINSWASCSITR